MLIYLLVFLYLAIGVGFAIWVRPSFDLDAEWLAVVPVVTLLWSLFACAVLGAKLYYDARHWWRWRWQRRAR